jgi:hypothetical protein
VLDLTLEQAAALQVDVDAIEEATNESNDESSTDANAEAEEPAPMQEQLVVQQLGVTTSNVIAEAVKPASDENPSLYTSDFVFDDSRDAEVDELDCMMLGCFVLGGDAFHATVRAKVSMYHDYKAS